MVVERDKNKKACEIILENGRWKESDTLEKSLPSKKSVYFFTLFNKWKYSKIFRKNFAWSQKCTVKLHMYTIASVFYWQEIFMKGHFFVGLILEKAPNVKLWFWQNILLMGRLIVLVQSWGKLKDLLPGTLKSLRPILYAIFPLGGWFHHSLCEILKHCD